MPSSTPNCRPYVRRKRHRERPRTSGGAGPAAVAPELGGSPPAVALNPPGVGEQVVDHEVVHGAAEHRRRRPGQHVRVNAAVRVPARVAAQQPDDAIVLPARETDHLAQEEHAALDRVGVVSRLSVAEQRRDLRPEFGGAAFVGVENQHPLVLRLVHCPVLLRRGTVVGALDEAGALASAHDLGSAVRGKRVDDQHFVAPVERRQAIGDVAFLVVGGHQGRNRRPPSVFRRSVHARIVCGG